MDGEISEADDVSLREDLDSAVPFHQLLDVSAGRSKAELARSGALSGRHKPSPDALRTAILKRSVSSSSAGVDSALADANDLSSREETPDSDSSGYNVSTAVASVPAAIPAAALPRQPSMPLPNVPVPNLKPNAQANPLVQEMRMRQQQQQQHQQQEPIPAYVNLPSAPAPQQQLRQQQQATSSAIRGLQQQQQQQHPRGGVPMPGFGSPPSSAGSPGASGPSLADQLKNRLEERRRSKEGIEGAAIPDRIAQDVEQAVRVANETGECWLFECPTVLYLGRLYKTSNNLSESVCRHPL